MSGENDIQKLNAIVGAALKAMAESGADDAFVGAFASTHRNRVAEILGIQAQTEQVPELRVMMLEAVNQALQEAGLVKTKRSTVIRYPVLVNGKRTSVTIDKNLFASLEATKGSKSAARAALQELASQAPESIENRSGWVQQRLSALLQSTSLSIPTARH